MPCAAFQLVEIFKFGFSKILLEAFKNLVGLFVVGFSKEYLGRNLVRLENFDGLFAAEVLLPFFHKPLRMAEFYGKRLRRIAARS